MIEVALDEGLNSLKKRTTKIVEPRDPSIQLKRKSVVWKFIFAIYNTFNDTSEKDDMIVTETWIRLLND